MFHSTKEAHCSFPKVTFKKQTYYITSAKQNVQTRTTVTVQK